MELMKKLFHGKGYIDGITIINLEGEILFTAKLNNKLSSQEEPYELVGQKFLDVYENLDPKTSTTITITTMELLMICFLLGHKIFLNSPLRSLK